MDVYEVIVVTIIVELPTCSLYLALARANARTHARTHMHVRFTLYLVRHIVVVVIVANSVDEMIGHELNINTILVWCRDILKP